jgi:flagellar motor switch protein FliM
LKHQLSEQETDSLFDVAANAHPSDDGGAIPFDFRRLDGIPKSQVGAIQCLHETFVRTLTSSLTIYLRTFVSGSLISVEQLPYSDFAKALANPACLVYLSMEPYEGHALIEVSPILIAPILDLVLGGSGKINIEMDREITEVEKALLEGFFQLLIHDLRETWKPVVALSFAAGVIETKPQPSGGFVPSEAVVAVAMEVRIGEAVGMVSLALPAITLKTMGQKFDQQWTPQRAENPATELVIKRRLARDLEVTVECEYSGATINMKDFLNLAPGEVFALGAAFDETVDVLINGTTKFRGALAVSPKNSRTVVIE